MKEDAYGIEAFNRRTKMEYYGKSFFLITKEDLLLAKIIWIQNTQSSLQMEDIKKTFAIRYLRLDLYKNVDQKIETKYF
ncbi:hypothetical protein BH10BAC3_BH10BAC3_16550 [soil metagenome]